MSEIEDRHTNPPASHCLEIKPLRLADAAVLRRMGVFCGSLKHVAGAIRSLLALNERGCYMVTGWLPPASATPDTAMASSPTGATPDTAMASPPAPETVAMTGFVALLPDAFHPEIGRLTVRATDPAFLPTLLEHACRTAFGEQTFLRLESLVPSFPENALLPYRDFGFRTDAIVPGALLRSPERTDLHMVSLPKTRNRYPGIGLVSYKLGLLSVMGTETQVDAIEFHTTGEPVASPYLRDLFAIWGLLDEKERLRPADACLRLISNDNLPAMVAKAVAQLDEYMSGERQEFDLDLNLAMGSPLPESRLGSPAGDSPTARPKPTSTSR